MLERRRKRKLEGYGIVPGVEGEDNIELGEGSGVREMGAEGGHDEEDEDGAWDEIGGSEVGDGAKISNDEVAK